MLLQQLKKLLLEINQEKKTPILQEALGQTHWTAYSQRARKDDFFPSVICLDEPSKDFLSNVVIQLIFLPEEGAVQKLALHQEQLEIAAPASTKRQVFQGPDFV